MRSRSVTIRRRRRRAAEQLAGVDQADAHGAQMRLRRFDLFLLDAASSHAFSSSGRPSRRNRIIIRVGRRGCNCRGRRQQPFDQEQPHCQPGQEPTPLRADSSAPDSGAPMMPAAMLAIEARPPRAPARRRKTRSVKCGTRSRRPCLGGAEQETEGAEACAARPRTASTSRRCPHDGDAGRCQIRAPDGASRLLGASNRK